MALQLFQRARYAAGALAALPTQLGLVRERPPTGARAVPPIAVIHTDDTPGVATIRQAVDIAMGPVIDRLAASEALRGAQHAELDHLQQENTRLIKINRICLGIAAATSTILIGIVAMRSMSRSQS